MIKKMIGATAVLLLLSCISLKSNAQPGLTSSVPSLEFTTAGGEKIITVSNITGPVSQGRVMKGTLPATGFTVVTGIRQEDRVAVSIVLERTNSSFSGYRLELLINKVWKAVPLDINVVRERQQNLLLINPAEENKKPVASKSGISYIMEAENKPVNISRQLLLKQKINQAIKNSNAIRNINAPEIKDWFPKDTGAIGGTFILIGKNLDSVAGLTLGSAALPILKRIKNSSFEAVIVQLPATSVSGTVGVTYPVLVGSRRTTGTMLVNTNYTLVDQFSSLWPSVKATVIDITPDPDFADRPHALKQYTYSILYEYVPGNIVKKYEWKTGSELPEGHGDRSAFRPASGFALSIAGEQSSGSGGQDASGGTFISGNMFVGSITGTMYSVSNIDILTGAEVAIKTARLNTQISSYLNSNSQAQEIKRSLPMLEFDYNTPQKFTINNTYDLRDVFDFNKFYSHGVTQGVSTGQSDVNVGILNVSSDLGFRIASGPAGTEAVWISKPFIMSDGWRVTQFNWNERREFPGSDTRAYAKPFNTFDFFSFLFGSTLRNNAGCRNYDVYRSIYNKPADSYHSKDLADKDFNFRYDPDHADASLTCNPVMRADPNGYRGHLDRQNIKGAFVNLKADRTGVNDHRVTMVLESINLLGPRGGNSSTAFNNIVRYEPLLAATAGHLIGIVYPEFFKLIE